MVGFIIDPEKKVIEKVDLPYLRHQAVNMIKVLLDSGNLSRQGRIDGFDLLLVVPEKIFLYGVAAFKYKNDVLVFGKAAILRYDGDEERVVDAEVSWEQLKECISFLSVEETDSIPSSVRTDCYVDLLLHKSSG